MTEFAEAELGDARRTRHVITGATQLAQQPDASFPEACGSGAALKATYWLLGNEAVACLLTAGEATGHHCRTLHKAGPNATDRPRRALDIVCRVNSNGL